MSTATRPDVPYSVNYLSRFQNQYIETHYKDALRILKYLYKTQNLKLTYARNLDADVVDSDWPGDQTDRKSTSRIIIRFTIMFRNSVFWKTGKQNYVSKSSIPHYQKQ